MERLLKIIVSAIIFSFVVFSIPMVCYAYTGPDNNEYEYKYRVYNGNVVRDLYTNDELCLCTQSGYTQDGGYRIYVAKNGFLYPVEFNYSTNVRGYTSVYPNLSGSTPYYFGALSESVNGDWACISKNVTGYSNLETFSTYQGAYDYLTTPRVDWDNIMYDPAIPTPIFSVYYNDDSSTLPRFNADIELKNASDDLYVYVTMDNSTPSTIVMVRTLFFLSISCLDTPISTSCCKDSNETYGTPINSTLERISTYCVTNSPTLSSYTLLPLYSL